MGTFTNFILPRPTLLTSTFDPCIVLIPCAFRRVGLYACSDRLQSSFVDHAQAYSLIAALLAVLGGVTAVSPTLRSLFTFAYACFLKPVRGSTQSARLDSFYKSQADVYDGTRSHLLKGRKTMLQLVASHVKVSDQERLIKSPAPGDARKKRIWVDIGGGTGQSWLYSRKLRATRCSLLALTSKRQQSANTTGLLPFLLHTGWNVESMDDYLPISTFDAVYIVDLCKPLLEVAARRFAKKGWKNVHCLHQDASKFSIPEWERGELKEEDSVMLVTMSYSMSMVSLHPRFPLHTTRDGIPEATRKISGAYQTYLLLFFDLSSTFALARSPLTEKPLTESEKSSIRNVVSLVSSTSTPPTRPKDRVMTR